MKVSAAVFALLLIAASCSSGPVGSDVPVCCFSYTADKLPHKRILRYYRTSTSCMLPAIVFITKKGHQVCANPSHTWVQAYLKKLELSKARWQA
ncbi:C-C motif chemokine 4-like [Melopsittacus undulatus]|uniref:C-C motif chemokine n=1 Tax=Melopsittacus undulatus TaxID=13146 RepID=A0A8V5GU76_MELUD|nr:C-C motif chemokine 4-like [Melopsittacus undulatus]